MKQFQAMNVYDAAIKRCIEVYREGHRVIIAFSAGKDSMAILEVCIEAARVTGRLPVEVWMRDEEIMLPGTYEYAERVASRREVNMLWLYAQQASLNIYNRNIPYYWAFDPELDEGQWMRKYPTFARKTEIKSLYNVINPKDFPPPDGKLLYVAMGVRGSESRMRNMMIHSSGGAVSGGGKSLERHFRPIYDWSTKDVWLAAKEKGWDYNHAYDVMSRFGLRREQQRIAPLTMTPHGVKLLQMASKAWPDWFDRLNVRLPGVRLAALYGRQALTPIRRPGETWKDAYYRINVDTAPSWLAERALKYAEVMQRRHAGHSTEPLLDMSPCPTCNAGKGDWMHMTHDMYMGDPFLLDTREVSLGYVEPETFRPGAGTWDGKPTFG